MFMFPAENFLQPEKTFSDEIITFANTVKLN